MKKITATLLLIASFYFLPSAPSPSHAAQDQTATEETAHVKAKKSVIARVGSGQVTLGQVMQKIKDLTIKKYGYKEITPTLAERIKGEAIEILINEELAYQHARSIGVKVTPQEIEQHIEAYKKSMGGDDKFREYLLTNDITIEQLKVMAERFLAVKKALAKEVDSKVREVTEADILQAYNEAKNQYFAQQEKIMVTDIIFFLDPNDKETQAKIASVRERLIKGLAGDITKLESDPTFVVRTNITLNESLDGDLYAAAKKMAVNEISGPINNKGTYHLLKMHQYIPKVEKALDEVRPYLKKKLQEKFRQDRLDEWRQGLRKDADVEIFETKME